VPQCADRKVCCKNDIAFPWMPSPPSCGTLRNIVAVGLRLLKDLLTEKASGFSSHAQRLGVLSAAKIEA
jgi:hypothetical protein